ncbi:MAG: glycosyltransferase [Victivallales bacterium]|jgi:hypothetical protein|nr:glycosyltransferase [Victivallales bacterium]
MSTVKPAVEPRLPLRHFADFSGTLEANARQERAKLGIADTEKVLLFRGDFVPKNMPGILLEAFLYFLQTAKIADWHLILAGAGSLETTLREMAKGDLRIHFLPFGEPAITYRIGDLCVSPIGHGNSVAEAMISSRAVLVTEKASNTLFLIQPGVTGWSVDSAHPELWFDYMKAASQTKLRAMGKSAQESFLTHFSEKKVDK